MIKSEDDKLKYRRAWSLAHESSSISPQLSLRRLQTFPRQHKPRCGVMASCVLFVVVGLFTLTAVAPSTTAFRVLGVFPFNARSHNIMFKAVMHALVDSGHEVVDFSPFPIEKPRANFTTVDFSKEFPSMVNTLKYDEMTDWTRFEMFRAFSEMAGASLCRKVFQSKQFHDIMSGAYGQFDVVFTEIFASECFTAIAHKLKVPLISISTADFDHIHERVGSVVNPSYIITPYSLQVGKMDLWQRCRNVLSHLTNVYLNKWLVQDPSDPVVREFFGEDTPPISELVKRTSLVMINQHVSVNQARPVNPNVINVAGIHLRNKPDINKIDKELRQWLEGARHGVIFFSLGSLVRADSLPPASVAALLAAFATLPQRVLWKYEDASIALPANVRVATWLPQSHILAHPNVILFITHGGLMGTSEALSLGVPMLGIPLFCDQGPNVQLYKHLGIAQELDHRQITKDAVLSAIHELTTSNKYRERARELAALYADRPMTAAQEAVWWTEYVVRHKGARHLRPLGADLPLHQYLLLDVAAAFLAAVGAVLAVVVVALNKLLAVLARKPPKSKTQ